MNHRDRTPITHPIRRLLFLCLGLITMAFGVAFSIKAGLGTSPISSVPYVTSEISGLSVGTTTIIMNFIFVLIQIAILRRQYDWFQVLQFPAAILFGFTIDVAERVIAPPSLLRLSHGLGLLCPGYCSHCLWGERGGDGQPGDHRRRGHCAGHLPGGPHQIW